MNNVILFLLIFLIKTGVSQDYSFHRSTLDSSFNQVMDPGLVKKYNNNNANEVLWKRKIKSFTNKKDSIFLSNRNYLTLIPFADTSLNKEEGHILFKNGQDSFVIKYFNIKDSLNLETFHGFRFFACNKIREIRISIGSSTYLVDEKYIQDLYEIWHVKGDDDVTRPIELYQSRNKNFYYLYIHGGGEASWYLSKFIFSKSGFEARIVVDYYDYITSGGLFEKYIGI